MHEKKIHPLWDIKSEALKDSCDLTSFSSYILSRWYTSQALFYDEIGQSFSALDCCRVGLEKCGVDNILLSELYRQLASFCMLLQEGYLDQYMSFLDWIGTTGAKRIQVMLMSGLNEKSPVEIFVSMIEKFFRPMFVGEERLYRKINPNNFLSLVVHIRKCNFVGNSKLDNISNWPVDEQWELILVREMVVLCRNNESQSDRSYVALSKVVVVAEASLPTLAMEERCIRNVWNLVELVVQCCESYDDLSRGMPLMWRLLETTPAKLEAITSQEKALVTSLDSLQATLTTAEILKDYMEPPALSIMRPYNAVTKMAQRRFIKSVLKGCAWLGDGLEPLLSAGSEESSGDSSQKYNLERAIVIAMCFAVINNHPPEKRDKSTLYPRAWIKLTLDVFELRESFLPAKIHLWAGLLLIRVLLALTGDDAVLFCTALDSLRSVPPTSYSVSRAKTNALEALSALGVTASSAGRVAVMRAREGINSCNRSSDPVLKPIADLLKVISTKLDSVAKKEALTELAVCELSEWMGQMDSVSLDIPPCQLRLISPADLVSRVMAVNPTAYLCSTLSDEGVDPEELGLGLGLGLGCKEDSALMLLARPRPPRGSRRLLQLLRFSHGAMEENDPSLEESPTAVPWRPLDGVEVWAVLAAGAARAGDCLAAYLLSMELLQSAYATEKVHSTSCMDTVDKAVTYSLQLLLTSALDGDEASLQMHRFLCAALLSNQPAHRLSDAMALWDRHKSLHDTLRAGMLEPTQNAGRGAGFAFDAGDIAAADTNATNVNMAREALLRVIGSMIVRRGDAVWMKEPLPSPVEFVRQTAALSSGVPSEAMGYVMLAGAEVGDEAVQSMLLSLSHDLGKKLTSCKPDADSVVRKDEGAGGSKTLGLATSMINSIDEELVVQLQAMGFSRNGSRRSVLATNNSTLERALRWAIDHCGDADFEEPLCLSVSNALLPDSLHMKVHSSDMQRALELIAHVSRAYSVHIVPLLKGKSESEASDECKLAAFPTTSPIERTTSDTLSDVNYIQSRYEQTLQQSAPVTEGDAQLTTHLARAAAIAALENVLKNTEDIIRDTNLEFDCSLLARSLVLRDRDSRQQLDLLVSVYTVLVNHKVESSFLSYSSEISRCLPDYANVQIANAFENELLVMLSRSSDGEGDRTAEMFGSGAVDAINKDSGNSQWTLCAVRVCGAVLRPVAIKDETDDSSLEIGESLKVLSQNPIK